MTPGNKKLAQRAVAVVVIVAMLDMVGVSPAIMLFMTGVAVVIWFVGRRSENRELEKIFDFYISADAILRNEDRKWYGFEVAEVIENGERALELMPDSPPLHYFALGALYHRIGNHVATTEYLSHLMDDEVHDELHRMTPSPQLRRYVAMLRRIEYEPAIAPLALGAVRNLERTRQKCAAQLLSESRQFLSGIRTSAQSVSAETAPPEFSAQEASSSGERRLNSISAPPPISDVLHDIYQDEKNTIQ